MIVGQFGFRKNLPHLGDIERQEAGATIFATTQWSVVLAAQGSSPAAEEALERICRTYWRPIFAFVRREGRTVEDAQDLTQGFFARLLERKDFTAVRREKGRLRSYLLAALKNFLAHQRQHARAQKRGAGHIPISLDEMREQGRHDAEPKTTQTADAIVERRWALTVLEQVLAKLGDEYAAAENQNLFERFKELLASEKSEVRHAEIAREFAMTENAVKQAFHRFRRRYRELLRDEIAQTVVVSADVEDELRHLVSVLRA